MRSERGVAFDPMWAAAQVTTVLGPLRVDPDDIDRRHAELIAAMPADSWWRRHPGPVTTRVIGDVAAAALEVGGRAWSGPPVRMLVGDRDVAVVSSHGIGDARTSARLVHDLLTAPGSPLLLPRLRRPSTPATLRAATAWAIRHPRALAAALRRPDPGTCLPAEALTVPAVPVLVTRAVPAGPLGARRDQEHLGVSLSAVLMSRLVAELGVRGIAPRVLSVPVDLRRYLPAGERGGNLVGLLRLTPDPDPAVVDRERRLAMDGGEPLVRYLAGRTRRRLRPVPPAEFRGEARPTLGWSDRGTVDEWDALPWGAGPRRVAAGLAPVWGRRIGVHVTRLAGVLHLACVVNAAAFDPDAVEDAVDAALATDPVATPAGGPRV